MYKRRPGSRPSSAFGLRMRGCGEPVGCHRALLCEGWRGTESIGADRRTCQKLKHRLASAVVWWVLAS